jgi:hypothetical protein
MAAYGTSSARIVKLDVELMLTLSRPAFESLSQRSLRAPANGARRAFALANAIALWRAHPVA